jgi:hypothetical protein
MREEARVCLICVACILRFTVMDRDGWFVLLARRFVEYAAAMDQQYHVPPPVSPQH